MTDHPAHSSAIARHPSASLYDRVFALAMPDAAVVAAHKNIFLLNGELELVVRYALKDTPRKTLKQVAHGQDEACFAVSLSINHALDVLAMKRLIMISDSICQKPAQNDDSLTRSAEDSLKQRFANDKALTCAIWKDPVDDVIDFVQSVLAGSKIVRPHSASVRATVQSLPVFRTSDGAQT